MFALICDSFFERIAGFLRPTRLRLMIAPYRLLGRIAWLL